MRGSTARAALAVALVAIGLTGLTAQTKRPPTFADYGKWETLVQTGSRGGLSPDGHWLVYGINRSNRDNELVILNLADGTKKTVVPFGTQPAFSSDSKWIAYAITQSEAEQEKLRSEQKPVQNRLGLLNLAKGEAVTIDAIESFAFSPDGSCLAIRPYAPSPVAAGPTPPLPAGGTGGGRGGQTGTGAEAEDRVGTTLVVRDLSNGRDTTFGNVSQYAWENAERGHLLALVISAAGKTGNGVQLFDPASGVLRVLDSSASIYTAPVWRKDAADLAVLRATTDDKKDGSNYAVLAWTGLGKGERLRTFDPASEKGLPAGMRTVSFRRPSWSDDGRIVFLGIARWEDKLPSAGRGERGGTAGAAEASTIDVWHANDVTVKPKQKIDAPSDRRRNLLAAWHVESGRLVPLGTNLYNEQVTPIRRSSLAWAAEWSKYAMNRTIGRPAADVSLVDVTTGTRTPLRAAINDRFVQAGPFGKCLLFIEGNQYWTIDLASRAVTNITGALPTSFIDLQSDQTSPQKPPFGVAGWTKDDGSVLLNDKYDVWQVPSDGGKAIRLTDGAAGQVRHRLVRLDPDEEWVDVSKPLYFSLSGEWTKKSGYARREPSGTVTRLVWLDRAVSGLAKADEADTFGYVVQDYDDPPDFFAGGPDLSVAKQVTKVNAFQSEYAWGRTELLEYKTPKGRRLQASLHYPAGYEAGRKYPMIVYNYELLSQNVHRYVAPTDREYYNVSVFTTQGYLVLQPDIVFAERKPGPSVIECVTAGVNKVIQMGVVDPKRIGVVGHSMGGYNTTILATRTHGVFAAAVAGAPMTDLVSYYGDHHWSSGIAETDHIETGQERMVAPLYEDLQGYIDNSAVFAAHQMTVPLLLEVGDQDGTVAWHQGIELYNVARRARKPVVMLAYMGEDHGLRQKRNQVDYQRRILEWFGHYLKGEPVAKWMTDGQSFLEREDEIRREAAAKIKS